MPADFYNTKQLCNAAGCTDRTLRHHVKKGYIAIESIPGVRGFRFRGDRARRWLAQRFPQVKAEALDSPIVEPIDAKPAFTWMQSYNHETAHLVDPQGRAVCDPEHITGIIGKHWHKHDTVKKCKRCMGKEHA